MRCIGAALALSLLLTGTPAQTRPPDDADKRISLDFEKAAIQDVIRKLFSGTGLNYAIGPRVADGIPPEGVTLKLEGISFEEALTAVLLTYGLTYRIDQGVYIIEMGRPAGAAPPTREQHGLTGPVRSLYEVEKEILPDTAVETEYTAVAKLSQRTTYDADGMMTERAVLNPDGSLNYRELYKYGAGRRVLEKSRYTADGTLDIRWLYTYDKLGDVTKETQVDANGSLIATEAYAYEFDPKGNWTKKTVSRWVTKRGKEYFEAIKVIERSIGYQGEFSQFPGICGPGLGRLKPPGPFPTPW
jgi:hypothetical protein